MAREAKAKAASCWLDRIMVTGAVMRHRTWGQSVCGHRPAGLDKSHDLLPPAKSMGTGSWGTSHSKRTQSWDVRVGP